MTTFAVVDVDEPREHIAVFTTGLEAGQDATKRNDEARADGTNTRYRVLRVAADLGAVVDETWKERELARFFDGTYKYLPWFGHLGQPDHYAHVSQDCTKVAYTPSAEYGAADRHLAVRPGRYLEQFFGDFLSQDDIRVWCGKFSTENEPLELKFASTPDDIEAVFTNDGPSSCMSHDACEYESKCHPVRVYGAGDLAVVYLERNGRTTARAMCWPEKKRYGRLYGDESRLAESLKIADYTANGDFSGARLLRIEDGDRFVAPYLEYPNNAVGDDGEYLVISKQGSILCKERNGWTTRRLHERLATVA